MEQLAEQSLERSHPGQLDRQVRLRTDTETWLAEVLNGSMRTSFEYSFDGRELCGEDGGAIGEIFDDAVETAQEIVRYNPSLLFELRRRLIERDEYDDMLKMAGGELPNTMIVVSDFPPELMDSTEDEGGYNVKRKQTMLRVITRQPDGSIRMISQSLEGSDRLALEAMYDRMEQPVEKGELLEQRMYRDLQPAHQDKLADILTQTYDNSLGQRHGGGWHAGFKQPAKRSWINTYEFAQAQHDIIEWFTTTKSTNPVAAESQRFRLAATVNERYERYLQDSGHDRLPAIQPGLDQDTSHIDNLLQEIEQSAQRAIFFGMVFSGCGVSVGLVSSEAQLEQAGYGNRAGSDKYGSLQFKCSKGHNNTRPRNKLISHCRQCGISVKC